MKKFVFVSAVVIVPLFALSGAVAQQVPLAEPEMAIYPGAAVTTEIGVPTEFFGVASSADSVILRFEWDYDGDGTFDYESEKPEKSYFTYAAPGHYKAAFRVTEWSGYQLTHIRNVEVIGPFQETESTSLLSSPDTAGALAQPSTSDGDAPETASADGFQQVYAVFIAGADSQHFPPISDMYFMLIDEFNADPDKMFVFLYNDGVPPNDPEIVDGLATRENLEDAFAFCANDMDDDDLFLFEVEAHGNGYLGYVDDNKRNRAIHGFIGGELKVSGDDDEKDYLEQELELSVFVTLGNAYDGSDLHFGMDEWGVIYREGSSFLDIYRIRAMSHFAGVVVEGLGEVSDQDVYLEKFTDYLLGDTDKNGRIENGEVADWDGDGVMPYNDLTGEFDEDDWGDIDDLEDDKNTWHSPLGDFPYQLFDYGLDNHVDIDVNPASPLEVDGTDLDNNGCIDGLDLNDDGDLDDWITINETMSIYSEKLIDDEVADYLDIFVRGKVLVVNNTCHGGGFVFDLSGENRTIITGSREVTGATAGLIHTLLYDAWMTYPEESDENGDGQTSIAEAFNYASYHPHYNTSSDRFQYDDNGDGVSNEDPLPNGGDGDLGSSWFLYSVRPVLGDVNGDLSIDIIDALRVAQYAAGMSPYPFYAPSADVNCDGLIDNDDAILIANYYVGNIDEFPCE